MNPVEEYYENKKWRVKRYNSLLLKREQLRNEKKLKLYIVWVFKIVMALLLLKFIPIVYTYIDFLGDGKYFIGVAFAICILLYLLWNFIIVSKKDDKALRNSMIFLITFVIFYWTLQLSASISEGIVGEALGFLAFSTIIASLVFVYALDDLTIYESRNLSYGEIQSKIEKQQVNFKRLNIGLSIAESFLIFLILLYLTGTDEKNFTAFVAGLSLFIICTPQFLEHVRENKMNRISKIYDDYRNKEKDLLDKKIKQLEERLDQLENNPQKVVIYKKTLLMSLVEKIKGQ